MEVMGVVAVMVNLALLGMGGSVQRMFPNMTVTDRIILIVVLEVSSEFELFWQYLPLPSNFLPSRNSLYLHYSLAVS